jgi:hypothetical protein
MSFILKSKIAYICHVIILTEHKKEKNSSLSLFPRSEKEREREEKKQYINVLDQFI